MHVLICNTLCVRTGRRYGVIALGDLAREGRSTAIPNDKYRRGAIRGSEGDLLGIATQIASVVVSAATSEKLIDLTY